MNIYQKACLAVALIEHLFTQQNIFAANLNGTVSFVYTNVHNVFSNNESARGFVRMNGGFTIKPGAKATLDTVVSVSGSIDLRESGILQLVKNLNLDTGVTWSSGGYINGRGRAIQLNGPLSIPESKTIHIIGDTIIDGKDSELSLGANAQIIIENNATFTLQNITIKNVRNNPHTACIRITSNGGKLALDNVKLNITGDMQFPRGQLYIHNDVVFSGTSSFIYTSPSPCFITAGGTFLFDIGTTFSFAPLSTNNELVILQDKTSSLFLNGASLNITSTGMRMTKGNFILDNKVLLQTGHSYQGFTNTPLTSQDYAVTTVSGFGYRIRALSWNPSGTVLAIGGITPENGLGGFSNTDEIRLYSFDGSTLTPLASQDYGSYIHTLAWNPAGTVLAVGGYLPTNGAGGFANTDELRLYSFNGSTLTPLTSQDYGTSIYEVAWNAAGTVLAVGGEAPVNGAGGFANTDEIRLYRFNGSTLTPLTSQDYGFYLDAIAWNPEGTVLAIGGQFATNGAGGFANTDELRLYSFNGSTLTPLTSQAYGTYIYSLTWNPTGTVLTVGGQTPGNGLGGFANTDEIRLYSFNGSTLTPLTSQDWGTAILSLAWNPTGTILAIGGSGPVNGAGGFANTDELRLYSFNGSTLTPLSSQDYGTMIDTVGWNPTGTVLAVGGLRPLSGLGGFNNTDELRLYGANALAQQLKPAFTNMLTFGKSSLGSSHDLSVEVLGGAHVIVDGQIVDDSA